MSKILNAAQGKINPLNLNSGLPVQQPSDSGDYYTDIASIGGALGLNINASTMIVTNGQLSENPGELVVVGTQTSSDGSLKFGQQNLIKTQQSPVILWKSSNSTATTLLNYVGLPILNNINSQAIIMQPGDIYKIWSSSFDTPAGQVAGLYLGNLQGAPNITVTDLTGLGSLYTNTLPDQVIVKVTGAPTTGMNPTSYRLNRGDTTTTINDVTVLSAESGNSRWIADYFSGIYSSSVTGCFTTTQNISYICDNGVANLYLGEFSETATETAYMIFSLPDYLKPVNTQNKTCAITSAGVSKAAAVCQAYSGGTLTIGDILSDGAQTPFTSGAEAGIDKAGFNYMLY